MLAAFGETLFYMGFRDILPALRCVTSRNHLQCVRGAMDEDELDQLLADEAELEAEAEFEEAAYASDSPPSEFEAAVSKRPAEGAAPEPSKFQRTTSVASASDWQRPSFGDWNALGFSAAPDDYEVDEEALAEADAVPPPSTTQRFLERPADALTAALETRTWVFVNDPNPYVSKFGELTVNGRPHVPRADEITCIVAGPGRGKSTVLRAYLADHYGKYPTTRFLFLSANIAYGSFLVSELSDGTLADGDVAFYKTDSVEELQTSRVVVCSLESLHKIATLRFTSIILDEARSIGRVPGGATSAYRPSNVFLLKEMIQDCHHVIACDADLLLRYDGEPRALGVDLCRFLCPQRRVVCQRLVAAQPAHLNRSARLFYDAKSAKRGKGDFYSAIDATALEWRLSAPEDRRPFAILVGSKKQATELFSRMRDLNVPTRVYSGATTNQKYAHFRDVAVAWDQVGCIISTTTLRVGVDVQMEFGRVFWLCVRLGCGLLDQGQSALRFRRVRDPILNILLENTLPPDARAASVAAGKLAPIAAPSYAQMRAAIDDYYAERFQALAREDATGRPASARAERTLPPELLDLICHGAFPAGGYERKLQQVDLDGLLRQILAHYGWPIVDTEFETPSIVSRHRQRLVEAVEANEVVEFDDDDLFVHGCSELERCTRLVEELTADAEAAADFYTDCAGVTALPETELTGRQKWRLEVHHKLKALHRLPYEGAGPTPGALRAFLAPGVAEGVELRAVLLCRTVAEQVKIDARARVGGDDKVEDAMVLATRAQKMRAATELSQLFGIECLWEGWTLTEGSELVRVLNADKARRKRGASDDMPMRDKVFAEALQSHVRILCALAPARSLSGVLKQAALALAMEPTIKTRRSTLNGRKQTEIVECCFEPLFVGECAEWHLWSPALAAEVTVNAWQEAHADVVDFDADDMDALPGDGGEPVEAQTAGGVDLLPTTVDEVGEGLPRTEYVCATSFAAALNQYVHNPATNQDETALKWSGWLARAEKVFVPSTSGHHKFLKGTFFYAKRRGIGRRYVSGPGLQPCPSRLRQKLCANTYHDIDVANAHPQLMYQLALKMGVQAEELPSLSALVHDRDGVYTSLQRFYAASREDTKTLVLTLLNGGGVEQWLRDTHERRTRPAPPRVHHHVEALRTTERRLVVDAFKAHFGDRLDGIEDEIKCERRAAVQRCEGELAAAQTYAARNAAQAALDKAQLEATASSIEKTIFAISLQEVEDSVLAVVDEALRAEGVPVDALIFDGVLARHVEGLDLDAAMRQAEAAVLDKTGYAVELVEKPLYAPTPTLAVPG